MRSEEFPSKIDNDSKNYLLALMNDKKLTWQNLYQDPLTYNILLA